MKQGGGYGNRKTIHNPCFSAMIVSFRNEIYETKLNKTKNQLSLYLSLFLLKRVSFLANTGKAIQKFTKPIEYRQAVISIIWNFISFFSLSCSYNRCLVLFDSIWLNFFHFVNSLRFNFWFRVASFCFDWFCFL